MEHLENDTLMKDSKNFRKLSTLLPSLSVENNEKYRTFLSMNQKFLKSAIKDDKADNGSFDEIFAKFEALKAQT